MLSDHKEIQNNYKETQLMAQKTQNDTGREKQSKNNYSEMPNNHMDKTFCVSFLI